MDLSMNNQNEPVKKVVFHPAGKRARPAAGATVFRMERGIPQQDPLLGHATRGCTIYWEVTCPRCGAVFGNDEDGSYQESDAGSASGSDESGGE